jgi:hypothetical protein
MSRFLALGVVAGLLATQTMACSGTYRVVKKTSSGGELALVGPPESAREKANGYMQSQCAQGFDIVEEGEAVVGSTTTARTSDGGKNIFGRPTQTTSADSTDKREWRIKFQCKGAAAAPASAANGVREVVIVF